MCDVFQKLFAFYVSHLSLLFHLLFVPMIVRLLLAPEKVTAIDYNHEVESSLGAAEA